MISCKVCFIDISRGNVTVISKDDTRLQHDMCRPFNTCDLNVHVVSNVEDADIIHIPNISLSNQNIATKLINSLHGSSLHNLYHNHGNKILMYINDDAPHWVENETKIRKYVAQVEKKYCREDIISIPLIMSDHRYIACDKLESLRSIQKEYFFGFIGNMNRQNRQNFKKLKGNDQFKYYCKDTSSFSVYNMNNNQAKLDTIYNFLQEIAKCKFVYCPRGDGSSSFRIFETLMAGSIPIVYDSYDLPWSSTFNINWSDFSIIGGSSYNIDDIKRSSLYATDIDNERYNQMIVKGYNFYKKYCVQSALNQHIINHFLQYKNEENK